MVDLVGTVLNILGRADGSLVGLVQVLDYSTGAHHKGHYWE